MSKALYIKYVVITANTKGQIKSEWIYDVINFPNYQRKNLKDFCPESFEVEYLKIEDDLTNFLAYLN